MAGMAQTQTDSRTLGDENNGLKKPWRNQKGKPLLSSGKLT